MRPFNSTPRPARPTGLALLSMTALGLMTVAACLADLPDNPVTMDQVARGRLIAVTHDCTGCHSHTKDDPGDPHWLAGYVQGLTNNQPFLIGPSQLKTYAANLTPDMDTGLGKYSARQLFNALRYGLDPADTPDVVITAAAPGQGNFPAQPHYLAPPMPWPVWRHMTDDELWDLIAYLQHGIKPVSNKMPDNQEPPDHWASMYTPDKIGPYPLPAFPSSNEEFKP